MGFAKKAYVFKNEVVNIKTAEIRSDGAHYQHILLLGNNPGKNLCFSNSVATMVNSFLSVSNLFSFRIGWLAPFLVRPCCVRHTLCVRYTLCVRNTLCVRQALLGIIYQIISQVQSSSTSDLYCKI